MGINELMVGDLVRVNKDVCFKKGTIVEVRGTDADNKLPERGLKGSVTCRPLDNERFVGGVWCDYLEPIPLTEEFFEKNGIEKVDYDLLKPNLVFESDDKRILITDDTNSGDGYWYVHVDNEDYDTIGGCDVKYVHQLQQLLRLCGYEMDVVM